MQDNNRSMSKMFKEALTKVKVEDVEKYQKEHLNNFFIKLAENLEIDMHEQYQELVGDDISEEGMKRSISIAFMEGKASIPMAKMFPEPPLQGYTLNFDILREDLFAMDGYLDLHRKCRETDVDIIAIAQPKPDGSTAFSIAILMDMPYGQMNESNHPSAEFHPSAEQLDEKYNDENDFVEPHIVKDPSKISFGGGNKRS